MKGRDRGKRACFSGTVPKSRKKKRNYFCKAIYQDDAYVFYSTNHSITDRGQLEVITDGTMEVVFNT
jgi:16S rRNA C1402 (ribose-2'-O) methylase RsmI